MKSIISLIASVGLLFSITSCQRQSQRTVEELKRLDERNDQAKDRAMQGTVPEPKPAKDVIFH